MAIFNSKLLVYQGNDIIPFDFHVNPTKSHLINRINRFPEVAKQGECGGYLAISLLSSGFRREL